MKKAQLEGMEQVMVIFIVIVIAGIFVGILFKIFLGGSKVEQLRALEADAVEIATFVSAMPELQCTRNNVVTKNCINKFNAERLKDSDFLNKNPTFYHAVLGFSRVTIVQIDTPPTDNIIIYDRSSALQPANKKRTISINIPRLIYNPLDTGSCFELGKGSCNYGYIKIEMFSS